MEASIADETSLPLCCRKLADPVQRLGVQHPRLRNHLAEKGLAESYVAIS